MPEILFEMRQANVSYRPAGMAGNRAAVQALAGVSLRVCRGEALGIIGESGSGKSTLARVAAGLLKPDTGDVYYEGRKHEFGRRQPLVQMVFQDPYGSLNPSLKVEETIGEGLLYRQKDKKDKRRKKVIEALAEVRLPRKVLDRYPYQLSGGQQQRVALARALVTEPSLLVLDEPLAALDVTVQAQLLLLLAELKARRGLSYLLITHNLAAVQHLCEKVAVMRQGRVLESGPVSKVLIQPVHPYTAKLLDAYLWPDLPGKRDGPVEPRAVHSTGGEKDISSRARM